MLQLLRKTSYFLSLSQIEARKFEKKTRIDRRNDDCVD